MKDEQQIRLLLSRYLANRCSEAELGKLFGSLATPEGKAVLKEFLDLEAKEAEKNTSPMDPAASHRVFERLSERIEQDQPPRILPLLSRRWMGQLAACFLGILMLAGIAYYDFDQGTTRTIATETGQKRTVILPDGSRAILNANSTLVYDAAWSGETARRVELEGEAFFDITHDPAHPFYVKTSRMEVKVLGTAFNVKSDQVQKIFETTLIRGKVTVRDLDAPERLETVLKPDEKAVFGQKSIAVAVQPAGAVTDRSAYWTKGHLVFEDEPVGVIAAELEKWYGVKIKVAEGSKDCRFYLNVKNETLPEVLELFEAVSGAKSEINGKTITLNGSLCPEN